MADEDFAPGGGVLGNPIGGPVVLDDCTMEDILSKLKLLRYETEFCAKEGRKFKLLSRGYFAVQTDRANEQFYYFTSLVSWLMNVAGHRGFPQPGQFDDPNAVSTNIMTELKAMNLPTRDLGPTRIRQGHGEAVLTVLTLVVDKALQAKRFSFSSIDYPVVAKQMDDEDEEERPSQQPMASDEVEDHATMDTDSDEELYVGGAAVAARRKEERDDMIVPQVSTEQWALEVERVGPLLQYSHEESRDWRSRAESSGVLFRAVEKMYPEVKQMLERMGAELSGAQEMIENREQSLTQQFRDVVEEFRSQLRELNIVQDKFNEASQNVTQLSADLNLATEGLEQVKAQIQEREEKSSDITPLLKIKEAVANVRSEIREMSLRIGILQHSVLKCTLQQSKAKRSGTSTVADTYDMDSGYYVS